MKPVQVCSAAEADFTEALRYYAARNPEVALQFDAEFDGALQRIIAGPEQFPAVDDRHRYLQLRRFPFLIIFRVFADGITVIAVAHTSRSPDFWRGR
ncbi:MAG: type II toxin-antitoxin system RelE/ParE family toxin [Planctomycetaceae bacterium]